MIKEISKINFKVHFNFYLSLKALINNDYNFIKNFIGYRNLFYL